MAILKPIFLVKYMMDVKKKKKISAEIPFMKKNYDHRISDPILFPTHPITYSHFH